MILHTEMSRFLNSWKSFLYSCPYCASVCSDRHSLATFQPLPKRSSLRAIGDFVNVVVVRWIWNTITLFPFPVAVAAIAPIFSCFVSDATGASQMVVFARSMIKRLVLIVVTENHRPSGLPEAPAPSPPSNVPAPRKKVHGAGIERPTRADDVIYTTNPPIK